MKRNTVDTARSSALEPLESRRLLSNVPAGVDAEPIQWQGQEHAARAGSWIVSVAGLHGKGDEQKAEADTEIKKHTR